MNELITTNRINKPTIDSREVAQMIGKRHDNLLRDIQGYVEILTGINDLKIEAVDFFTESSYQDAKGETRPRYLITRKGCDMVANKMTGEKGVKFTALYVTKFERMEFALNNPFKIPQTYTEALRLAADFADEIERQKPLVAFAESCATSTDCILVRELAKLASKEGMVIGQNRLYEKLRKWGLIIPSRTEPYQEYIDRGYFEVAQIAIETANGVKLRKTTRVTPKGQIYIIGRLKKELLQAS